MMDRINQTIAMAQGMRERFRELPKTDAQVAQAAEFRARELQAERVRVDLESKVENLTEENKRLRKAIGLIQADLKRGHHFAIEGHIRDAFRRPD